MSDLLQSLLKVNDSTEGNLLEHTDVAETQLAFIFSYIGNSERILETGTNKCLFAYAVTLHLQRPILFYSFDIDIRAKRASDVFNESAPYGSKIEFMIGDTKQTLPEFMEPVDFAWIDGGHDYPTALSDICNAVRLGAKTILVDDFSYPFVKHACLDAIANTGYSIVATSEDNRTIAAICCQS